MPKYWEFACPSDAAVNSGGEIYVLSRKDKHPVTIWDKNGNFISSWGEGLFSPVPHVIYIAPNDNVWIVDRDYHICTEYTPGGEPLRTLGTKLSPSCTWEGKYVHSEPFNMPAALAIAPNGNIFVADGYGAHRVWKFSPDGKVLLCWGRQGTGPGEFALVHNIWIDKNGRVLVCDDENHRIQIFDDKGGFLEQWDMTNPSGICIHKDIVYVAQLGPYHDPAKGPGWGSISLWALDGTIITSWTGTEGGEGDMLFGGHDLCVDDEGSIYYCEGDMRRVSKFRRL
jgi:hypothetical protein